MLARLILALAVALAACHATPAMAGVLDRVRQAGVLRCGGAIRPGLAYPAADHAWHGLEIETCRAIAVAVLGADARTEFNSFTLEKEFAEAADGTVDVSFLTGSEIFANRLFGAVLVGPAVFYETTRIMVWDDRPFRSVKDLAGVMVCAEPGTGPERNLQAYMRRKAIGFRFSGWQELEEEMDAFNVGRCPAIAGEQTALAALALASRQEGHPARQLPEALAATPISAATATGDTAWANIVGWAVRAMLAADHADGPQGPALPVGAGELGLDTGWQARMVGAVGTYADIFDRTLGQASPLDLLPGLNARWNEGGIFAPPTVE